MSKTIFDGFKNLEEKTDFIIAIIVIILAGLLIGYFTFFPAAEVENGTAPYAKNNEVKELIIDDQVYTPLVISKSKKRKKKLKAQKVNTIPATRRIDSLQLETPQTESSNNILPAIPPTQNEVAETLTEIEAPVAELDEVIEKEEVIIEEEKVSIVADTPSEVPAVIPPTTPVSPPSTPAVITEDEKSCAILIGSFAQNKNKTALTTDLKNDGYSVFQKPFKGLTRIGIYYNCEKEDLEERLSIIQKKYAADAIIFELNED